MKLFLTSFFYFFILINYSQGFTQKDSSKKNYVLFNSAGAKEFMKQFDLPLFYKWPDAEDVKYCLRDRVQEEHYLCSCQKRKKLISYSSLIFYPWYNFFFIDADNVSTNKLQGLKIWTNEMQNESLRIVYEFKDMYADYLNPDDMQTGAAMLCIPDFSKNQFQLANDKLTFEGKSLFNNCVNKTERESLLSELLSALAFAHCYEPINSSEKINLLISFSFQDGLNQSYVFLSEETPLTNQFLTKVIQTWDFYLDDENFSNLVINEIQWFHLNYEENKIDVDDPGIVIYNERHKLKTLTKKGVAKECITRNYTLTYDDTKLPNYSLDVNAQIVDELEKKIIYEKYIFANDRKRQKYFQQIRDAKLMKDNKIDYVILWDNIK